MYGEFHDGFFIIMLPWKPKQRGKMNYTFLRKQRGKLKLLKFET